MQKEGIIILKGKVEKEKSIKYYLTYEGRTIAEGKNIYELRKQYKDWFTVSWKKNMFKEWKDQDIGALVVRKYRIREGQQVNAREGFVVDLNNGRATGSKQWEFIEWWDKDSFEDILKEIDIKNLK